MAIAPGALADDDLAVFLEMSNEIFGVFDLEQGLVWSNGTAAALLGYAEDELRRMSLVDLIHPDDLVEALGLFDQPSGDAEPAGVESGTGARTGPGAGSSGRRGASSKPGSSTGRLATSPPITRRRPRWEPTKRGSRRSSTTPPPPSS